MRLPALLLLAAPLGLAGCNCGPGSGGDAGVDGGVDAGALFGRASFPALTLAPLGDEVVVRAGHGTTPEPGLDVAVAVTGGSAASPAGTTGSSGEYRTTIVPAGSPAKVVSVQVTVSDDAGAQVVQTLEAAIADPGLRATYGGGAVLLEGPVRHGWASECGTTGNNLYQGECLAVSASPVNWAWGTFSVAWSGMLRSPVGGDIYFQSSLWVDGKVHIVIDGALVADLDTTGGGYSRVVPLDAGVWVPVSMTFAGNGGSNNMHLGWGGGGGATLPSGAWVPVPRVNLATPR